MLVSLEYTSSHQSSHFFKCSEQTIYDLGSLVSKISLGFGLNCTLTFDSLFFKKKLHVEPIGLVKKKQKNSPAATPHRPPSDLLYLFDHLWHVFTAFLLFC